MRNFYHWLHLWLSVPVGLFFSIICLTGALMVFEKEITGVVLEVAPQYVETSEITGTPKIPFFRKVRYLHRYMLDKPAESGAMTTGKMIVGVTTLTSLVILVSGFLLWLPRSRRGLLRRLSIRTNRGWRCFWRDLHVSLGFYSAVFLLLMALTGLTWSFGWYHDLTYSLLDKRVLTEKVETHAEMRAVQRYKSERRPGATDSGAAKNTARETRMMIRNLHIGSIGGFWTKIIWFVSALIGASLPLTGYYLWYKRLRRS